MATKHKRNHSQSSGGGEGGRRKRPPTAPLYGELDDMQYREFVAWGRQQRHLASRVLLQEERLDIMFLQAALRHDKYLYRMRTGRNKPSKFAHETARLLRRGVDECRRSWKEYIERKPVSAPPENGARGAKKTSFRRTKKLRLELREWLYWRNMNRQRTVAKDVLAFLIESGVLPPSAGSGERARPAGLRAVQRYVKSLGYKKRELLGRVTYAETDQALAKRDRYVFEMMKAREQRRRVVYMDESYIC